MVALSGLKKILKTEVQDSLDAGGREIYTGEFFLRDVGSGMDYPGIVFIKRKAEESTRSRVLALDRAMQSKTARLEILERRIKVVEAVAKERINKVLEATNEKIKKVEEDAKKKWKCQRDYNIEQEEYDGDVEMEMKKKEEEYKIIIALQESKIEEMAKTQKQLIEKMEKLEERMINVEFPPIAPKIVNPFDLFIKTN